MTNKVSLAAEFLTPNGEVVGLMLTLVDCEYLEVKAFESSQNDSSFSSERMKEVEERYIGLIKDEFYKKYDSLYKDEYGDKSFRTFVEHTMLRVQR